MKKLWLLCYLITAIAARGSDQLSIVQFETKKQGYDEFSNVVIAFASTTDNGTVNSSVTMKFDGRLTDAEGKPHALKNSDFTMIGFNIRKGVGIYGMGLVMLWEGSCKTVPHLEEVIGRQMQQVDAGLNPQSVLLEGIEGNTLKFKYVGEEVSPHYFDFYASATDGKIQVDRERLKRSLAQANLK